MWWFVGISGLQCFDSETWAISAGTHWRLFRVYGGIFRRHAMCSTGVSSVVSPCPTVLERIVPRNFFNRVLTHRYIAKVKSFTNLCQLLSPIRICSSRTPILCHAHQFNRPPMKVIYHQYQSFCFRCRRTSAFN